MKVGDQKSAHLHTISKGKAPADAEYRDLTEVEEEEERTDNPPCSMSMAGRAEENRDSDRVCKVVPVFDSPLAGR